MSGLPSTLHFHGYKRYRNYISKTNYAARKPRQDKELKKTVWIKNDANSETKKETNEDDRVESEFEQEPKEEI